MHSFPSPLPFPRLFSMFVIAALRCFASPLRYATRVCYAAALLFVISYCHSPPKVFLFAASPPICPDIPRYTPIYRDRSPLADMGRRGQSIWYDLPCRQRTLVFEYHCIQYRSMYAECVSFCIY